MLPASCANDISPVLKLTKGIDPATSAHLDMIRGAAALAVLIGHLRGLFFVDYRNLAHPSAVTALLYAGTSLGHQAVMVFFVLSGFLVGGSVITSVERWSWKHYLVNRLTRLYLVLLPALLLAVALNSIGERLPSAPLYYLNPIAHFHPQSIAERSSVPIFLGNLFFLQTIQVPVFGGADPVWSLANEAWYYILFPLIIGFAFPANAWSRRLLHLAGACLVIWFLPGGILLGFLVWLLGVAVRFAPRLALSPLGLRLALAIAVLPFAGSLAFTNRTTTSWGDSFVGVTFACLLYLLCHSRRLPSRAYIRTGALIAGCSYSVYVVHFPIVILIRAIAGSRHYLPSFPSVVLLLALTGMVFALGYGFSLLTERHTDEVRRFLLRPRIGVRRETAVAQQD
jgi:peptidoglycan/LPS O-acetylase OafA/YrhL